MQSRFIATIGRSGRSLSTYVLKRLQDAPVNYDPEFETFTYWDPTTVKRNYLLKLDKGDLLVFYAGLKPYENSVYDTALFLIGYFTIDRIIDFDKKKEQIPAYCEEFTNNAHVRRDNWYYKLVIATGDKKKSRLLDRAVKISERRPNKAGRLTYATSAEMEQYLGINCFIERSVPPRFIEGETHLDNLKKLLEDGEFERFS